MSNAPTCCPGSRRGIKYGDADHLDGAVDDGGSGDLDGGDLGPRTRAVSPAADGAKGAGYRRWLRSWTAPRQRTPYLGARFSLKADSASIMSGDREARTWLRFSSSSAASREGASTLACTASLLS
jgi:hypothetical protein